MIDGVYHAEDPAPDTARDGEFPAVPGRYHLYAAWNCPWAHRALLVRALKRLPISVAYARPRRTDDGWVYDEAGEYSDPLRGISALHEAYARAEPPHTGPLTVPLLWDRETDRAVSNESADLVRMLNRAFPEHGPDLCPNALEAEIDGWNDLIYRTVNNGVYRAGFAKTQEAYDAAVYEVFETLDAIEAHLGTSDWLAGNRFTEADLRLFPTLARFDVAYHYAFKCNIRRIMDYPKLWNYARRIYAMDGVSDTVRFRVYKTGYLSPSKLRNPLGIVPAGPEIDWSL